MEREKFINRCVDEGFSWKRETHKGDLGYLIGSEKFDTITHFTDEAIKNNDWEILKRQIVQGKDITQYTRIVGYYSAVKNWKKSKLGFLYRIVFHLIQ